jgi:arylsulfatase A-like enzyme
LSALRLLRISIGLLLVPCVACDSAPADFDRNLILIVVDTLRADHMGLHGYGRATTPELDRFASERAVVFENARSTAPWTKPSVASILTGLDPRQHRVLAHTDALHSSFQTLAKAFGENGWRTHGIQSNPYLLSLFGFDGGFINYEDSFFTEDERGTVANHDGTTGENVNARALQWLDQRDESQPFFLYVHHYEPHHMYLREEPQFVDALGSSPDADRREMLAAASMDALTAYTGELLDTDVAYLRARYDSEILFQDQLLGELFSGLEQRGLFDNSVVVVTSDHGEEFLEHGDLSHHNDKLFEELLHVPLLIAAPDVASARRSDAVSLVDLGSTLLELCGLGGASFPGTSYAALAHGQLGDHRQIDVVAHGMIPASADGLRLKTESECLVFGSLKLIRNLIDGSVQLFDLHSDPLEQVNLATQSSEDVQSLTTRLDTYLEARGGVGGELPMESEALLRSREDKLKELESILNAMGYTGD